MADKVQNSDWGNVRGNVYGAFEHVMTFSDWAIVCATLLGPILAVQAQKWVERATESRKRRLWIFTTVMANRATRLADENIKALNAIDLEYRPRRWSRSKKDADVISAWRSLFGELTLGSQALRSAGPNPDPAIVNAWNDRCSEYYVRLESAMSAALGFSFTDEELRRGIYYPQGHFERETAQLAILLDLKRLLSGETAINMNVKEVPVNAEAAAAQAKLVEKVTHAYAEDGSLKISVVDDQTVKRVKTENAAEARGPQGQSGAKLLLSFCGSRNQISGIDSSARRFFMTAPETHRILPYGLPGAVTVSAQ